MSSADLLGREFMRLRMARGLSLRRLARVVGMSAHSGLVDYERGRRIPPPDLMNALVDALRPADERLTVLYETALAERAWAASGRRTGQPPWNQYTRCTRCSSVLAAAVAALEDALAVLRGVQPHSPDEPATGVGA